MPQLRKIYIYVIAACFMIGCINHVADIVNGGPFPYTFAPFGFNVFWTALSVIDLLVVVLLIAKLRAGLIFAAIVMVLDVTLNSYAIYGVGVKLAFWPVQIQTIFCGFVLGALPALWDIAPRHSMVEANEISA
ncbi:hypothetical protein [Microbulbifer sp. PAAF003]|uniref:hypothetical protein n=1 Tax=Microbulbifer sp. PAAF003 TaxID=3243375 RepID=UPI004038FCB2